MPKKKKTKKKKLKKPAKKAAKIKKKKFPGTTFKKKKWPKLVGDSYQADEKTLKKIRRIAKKRGISKAEILRYASEVVVQIYDAIKDGKKKVTINVSEAA